MNGKENFRGFALITALLLLIGLTLLAVAAMRTAIFDEKAAGNMAFRNSAHNLAEAALKAAVAELNGIYVSANFAGSSPALDPPRRIARVAEGAGNAIWKNDAYWTAANSVAVPIAGLDASKYPRYSTEFLQSERSQFVCTLGSSTDSICRDWYRITARAVDPTTGAAVVLQQTTGLVDNGK